MIKRKVFDVIYGLGQLCSRPDDFFEVVIIRKNNYANVIYEYGELRMSRFKPDSFTRKGSSNNPEDAIRKAFDYFGLEQLYRIDAEQAVLGFRTELMKEPNKTMKITEYYIL